MNDYVIVARQQVLRSEARCICCHEPFSAENVFTREGMAEISISGYCESCFDKIFEGEDDDRL